jgi:uncharacterized protein YuzE
MPIGKVGQPIVEAAPELFNEIMKALRSEGRAEVAEQRGAVHLKKVTYDATVDAGYLYVTESRTLNIAEQNIIAVRHKQCVVLDELPGTVVVDLDNLGRVMGN